MFEIAGRYSGAAELKHKEDVVAKLGDQTPGGLLEEVVKQKVSESISRWMGKGRGRGKGGGNYVKLFEYDSDVPALGQGMGDVSLSDDAKAK